jgi:hypothetical protein
VPDFNVDSNASLVAADLVATGVRAGAKAFVVTQTFGQILLANVRRRASLPRTGPPGPRLQTGDYVRSMSVSTTISGGGPTATAGTNAPQARRLEFGFNGTDSLGRRYTQPAYAHWGPALDEVAPAFVAAIASLATGLDIALPSVPKAEPVDDFARRSAASKLGWERRKAAGR